MERDAGGIPPSRPKDPVFIAAKLEPATQRNKRAAKKEKKKKKKKKTRRQREENTTVKRKNNNKLIVGVMSVIDILSRVDVLCKKYEKYDLDKQRGAADSMSGNDQFLRLYTVLEADVEAAIQVLVLLFPRSCLPNASFPVTVVLDGCCSRLAFFAFLRGFMTHGSLLRRHFCPMFCL